MNRHPGAVADIRWARREDAVEIARLFLHLVGRAGGLHLGPPCPARPVARGGRCGALRPRGRGFLLPELPARDPWAGGVGMVHAFEMRPRAPGEVKTDPVLAP